MGRKARLKTARRAASAPPVSKSVLKARKAVLTTTLALTLLLMLVVGVLLLTKKTDSPVAHPAASVSAADRNAPAPLVAAARDVGFHPTTAPGIGGIEDQPASAAAPPSNPNLLTAGTTAPGFTLKTPTGETVSLSDFRGKAVLIEFFATWCPHCNAESPHIRSLSKSLPSSKYAFVSINADGETAPSVFAYHLYFGFDFPALLDPSSRPGSFSSPGDAGPVSVAYRVQSFPTFYVVDTNGRVAWASDGEQPNALLRQQLARAAGA